jgi:ABC-type multidrug transport system fused ATPase/permease subunit
MSPYLQILGRYLSPLAPRAGLLALCLLGSIGLQLYIPQIIRVFIDLATGGGNSGDTSALTRLALTYLAFAVLNQLLSAASTYLSADVGWAATNALRGDLFRHALGLDMAYHKDRTPGEMIERIDGDVTSVSNFFSQFVVRVSAAVLLTIGVLVLLWREDWRVGLPLTIFTACALVVLHWRRAVAVEPTREEREMSARLFGFIEERLSGLDDIRANGAGPYVMHRFLQVQREWFAKSSKAWWARGTIWLSTGSMFAAGYVLTLGLGIWLYLSGSVTLGTVYLFFNYMTMLESPLDQITQQLQEFQKAAAGLRRVRQMLDVRRDVLDGPVALPFAQRGPRVEFDRVRFRYAERDVLHDVSFTLEPGETVGVLGRTGSGKTTLIRLLFRLYDATAGRVLLDGVDLRQTRIADVRGRVGLVTQDVQLFRGTLRDNLTFFDRAVTEDRVQRAVERLGIGEWIERVGLDTLLEPGGAGLSAGESQLLAFARVFLKDPGLVILDEPSSRLDPATERLLTTAVGGLLAGRTGIIIAHRLQTVERVDRILVLAGGRVAEFGRREDLARDPGSRYSQLLALSSAGLGASLDESIERLPGQ